MDKHNKCCGELREHMYGSRSATPKRDKNGHRIPMDEDRPRRERPISLQNTSQSPYRGDHLNCPPGRCFHSQHEHQVHRAPVPAPDPAPAPVKLSRNHEHDCPCHQQQHQAQRGRESELGIVTSTTNLSNPQNHIQHHSARKVNQNSRNFHTHNRDPEPEIEKAEGAGDWLLYKNPAFRQPTSSRPEEEDPVQVNEYSHKPYLTKDSNNYLDNARAYCAATDERIRQALNLHANDSNTSRKSKPSQTTVISAKSGQDLRSLIRSQIELQHAVDHSLLHLDREIAKKVYQLNGDDKKESDKVSALDMGSFPSLRKQKSPKREPEVVTSVSDQPDLNTFSLVDFTSSIFDVTPDDIIKSKVIDPMTRKIQLMYLNSLREEFAIMEYLDQVPKMIKEVYREVAERDQKKSSSHK